MWSKLQKFQKRIFGAKVSLHVLALGAILVVGEGVHVVLVVLAAACAGGRVTVVLLLASDVVDPVGLAPTTGTEPNDEGTRIPVIIEVGTS